MYRFFITIALFFMIVEAKSQTIAVKSFTKLETDQDARITSPKTDQNGKKCAIIKVQTSHSGFVFDFGMIGNALATEQHTGEIWVWVPAGARKVTISHQQLGVLRNYSFDIDIEEATVYEMVLITGQVITKVEEEIASQFLVINTIPSGADVYIDDLPAGQTTYQKELPLGKHTYRISHDLYLPTAGSVVLTAEKKETFNLTLKPDFGILTITTSPENGATVSLDGQPTGKTTPCSLQQVRSGEHTVTLRLNMYKTASEKVNMQAGGEINLPVTLTPTFAGVTVNTNPASEIYIAGELKGNGTWSGRLSPGIYLFEARKDKYTPATERHEVVTGQPLTVTLEPVAKNGMLTIMTTPTDATITLDGVNKGTSPAKLRNLLVGDYTLILSLPNYTPITKKITINEGQTTQLNETLTISSEPSGAVSSIDGNKTTHTVQSEKKAEKSKTAIRTGAETILSSSFVSQTYTERVNGISIDMVAVKGGTFQMGSSDGESDEKPVHSVTVGDFSIGKYEVTQAQWKAIIGNNPSTYKGDNLPVEHVTWDEIQVFLSKLNELTGRTYRLPTEAEWEYAAGALAGTVNTRTKWSGTNNEKSIGEYAWYISNSNNKTHAFGTKQPNGIGLYDMSGNVWEMCADWYGSDYYANSSNINPSGPSTGSTRVCRGGSWNTNTSTCRVTKRGGPTSGSRDRYIGFRLVLESSSYDKTVSAKEEKRLAENETSVIVTPEKEKAALMDSSVVINPNDRNHRIESADCEMRKIGDYCFTNKKDILIDIFYGKGPLFPVVTVGRITLQPGQTSCIYELESGAWKYKYQDPSIRVHTGFRISGGDDTVPAVVSGQFLVEKCKSKTMEIK